MGSTLSVAKRIVSSKSSAKYVGNVWTVYLYQTHSQHRHLQIRHTKKKYELTYLHNFMLIPYCYVVVRLPFQQQTLQVYGVCDFASLGCHVPGWWAINENKNVNENDIPMTPLPVSTGLTVSSSRSCMCVCVLFFLFISYSFPVHHSASET